jgi:hypothetical protein
MAAIYSNGGNRWNILGFNFTTRQKTPSPLLSMIEQCFAAHVVHTCQQY